MSSIIPKTDLSVQGLQPTAETEARKLTSLEDLEPYIGKVVKYTGDGGHTWSYVLLENLVYKTCNSHIEVAGISAVATTSGWYDRSVSAKVFIDRDTFDLGRSPGSVLYCDLVFPYFETVSYDEFKDLHFTGHGQLLRSHASSNTTPVIVPRRDAVSIKAPFTLVRTDRANVDLKISLLFGEKFTLIQPTFPLPVKDSLSQKTSYSWKVHVNPDNTLNVSDAEGSIQKVRLIWWEAQRTNKKAFNLQESTCVRRSDLTSFLSEVLTRKGLAKNEQAAFIAYWQAVLEKDNSYGEFLQIRLLDNESLKDVLPPMEVSSKSGDFDLRRLYFQMVPTKAPASGLSREEYVSRLAPDQPGSNTVFDLGGEVVNLDGQGINVVDDSEFNEHFINQHIRV